MYSHYFCRCLNARDIHAYYSMDEEELIYYTPCIYADGYIVFAFPFIRSYVHSFVH